MDTDVGHDQRHSYHVADHPHPSPGRKGVTEWPHDLPAPNHSSHVDVARAGRRGRGAHVIHRVLLLDRLHDEEHLMLKLKLHHVPEKGVTTRVRMREKA